MVREGIAADAAMSIYGDFPRRVSFPDETLAVIHRWRPAPRVRGAPDRVKGRTIVTIGTDSEWFMRTVIIFESLVRYGGLSQLRYS